MSAILTASRLRGASLVLLAVAMTGCGTIKGWFNDTKKENIEPPTPLAENFSPTIGVQRLWSERIGKGAEKTGALMRPAYADGKLYAASTTGVVAAYDAATGKTLWSKQLGSRRGFLIHRGPNSVRWGGGPSVDGDLVVVGTLEGTVQAFNAGDGSERWTAQVSSEVIAPPAIGGGMVYVRTNDGHIVGLDRADGSRKWVYDRSTVPLLSLRGNSAPVFVDGVVYSGEDNGKIIALRASDGAPLWEQVLSPGEGRTEIDRLQDVDGQLAVADGIVYAAGYKGQTAALSAQTGRPVWTHEVGTYGGVALSASQIYLTDSDANVYALDLRTGSSQWKQDALKYRWLGEPAVQGDAVVVGDLEGWVHWLSINDGKLLARERVSKAPIRSAPVVVGDMVYVETIYGDIAAYRVGGGSK
ncbi:outer membrane protein assembly factor BamB [Rudaea sp.]|uniref:outer membrane protein assembly factor BamB n=1 Tax=Rudaea sp. TaxID=2136325 RepID=UPI00321FDF4C